LQIEGKKKQKQNPQLSQTFVAKNRWFSLLEHPDLSFNFGFDCDDGVMWVSRERKWKKKKKKKKKSKGKRKP
jgi:hypothetical protein